LTKAVRADPVASRGVSDVEIKLRHRTPHEVLGRNGYSILSNDFMAEVLAPLIAQHRLPAGTVAVLLHVMGKQKEGIYKGTHAQIAKKLKIHRTNVTTAMGRLAELGYLAMRGRGVYYVNPKLAFRGNGDVQEGVLFAVRAEDLASGFPDEIGPADLVKDL
jgi:hypothetical protein